MGVGRRHHDGQHRIHQPAGEEHVQRPGQLRGAGERPQVHRVRRLRRAGQGAQPGPQRLGQLGDLQAGGPAGVGGHHGQRVGVADDPDPPTGGQRLVGEQLRGREQLRQRADPHHAGRGEQRVDRDVALPVTALERHDRLATADLAGDAGELAGVAEALQVHQHHLGALVRAPVLQQVVARHVGPVADADERGQPEAAALGLGQERPGQGAGLAEDPDGPGRR